MRIEHVAIWCKDLERMKYFYAHFFKAKSNDRYENSTKGFRSYFLTLPDGPRIELMQMDSILISAADVYPQFTGLAHIAFSVGSELKVEVQFSTALFISKFCHTLSDNGLFFLAIKLNINKINSVFILVNN